MRAPGGDRTRPALAALCLAVVICTAGAGALNASYRIAPGGMSYNASVEVADATEYLFWDYG
ncbi:MAG TPA: hypothetical protein VMB35_00005, partial [Methanomicrobiales archaeon]|nr:hypothetical protein [Methanomicrobiales archaeon]